MEEGQGTPMLTRNVAEALVQTEDTEERKSLQPRRMSIDTQSIQQGGEVRIGILRSMMSHRVDILKNLSQ